MNKLFRQQKSDSQQPNSFFVILHWLVNLFQLTEEEQEEAGIYIRHS